MLMTTDFIFHTVQNSRIDSVNLRDLPFGSVFSDHQFQMNFKNGEWQQGEISPYGDMSLSPAAMALHYGQAILEGMKAFRQPDGSVALFRPIIEVNNTTSTTITIFTKSVRNFNQYTFPIENLRISQIAKEIRRNM